MAGTDPRIKSRDGHDMGWVYASLLALSDPEIPDKFRLEKKMPGTKPGI
jgi:hypothetical protein